MTHGPKKSDLAKVAMKPTNKAGLQTGAESGERRAGTKGNVDQQSTRRTQIRDRAPGRSGAARSSRAVRAAAKLRRAPSRPRISPRSIARSAAASTTPSQSRRPATLPSATAPAPRAATRTAAPGARSARLDAAPPVRPAGAASPSASLSGVRRPPAVRPPLAGAPQPAASLRVVGVAPAPCASLNASSVPRM